MFNKKTVFVIGAGCSREYGLPVGDGLRDAISELLAGVRRRHRAPPRDDYDDGFYDFSRPRDEALYHAVASQRGRGEHPNIIDLAHEMSSGVRHASSIDRYLHVHRSDERIVTLGKLAITRAIIAAEAESTLAPTKDGLLDLDAITVDRKTKEVRRHWLGELFLRMQTDPLDRAFENVAFVCFNYDRCIEHYLFHAVMEFGHLDAAQAKQALKKLEIYHPYGTVARLPWQATEDDGTAPLPFGQEVKDGAQLIELSGRIATFTETIEEAPWLAQMRETVRTANQLVFMGFSFLPQNMELITPAHRSETEAVFATAYREPKPNVRMFEEQLAALLKGSARGVPHPMTPVFEWQTAGEFLGAYGNFLAR